MKQHEEKMQLFQKLTGPERLKQPINLLLLIGTMGLSAWFISSGGIFNSVILIALPFLFFFLSRLFSDPKIGLWTSIYLGFLSMGISRYLPGPLGLSVDFILFLTLLAVLFLKFERTDFNPVKNDLMLLVSLWMVYNLLQILNPEARSFEAWFYAVRGVALYQLFAVFIAFMLLNEKKDLNTFLQIVFWVSIVGTFWGIKQMVMGVDAAEQRWLDAGNASTHILFGKLRVFSFYSDAGQFGASQGHIGLVGLVLALGNRLKFRARLFYGIAGLICLWGMMISGTRGALAVPAFGFVVFLILTKNFKLLSVGFIFILLVFYILKFTFLFQNIEQVARMRTALDPENPSFQTRLRNQQKLAEYLSSRPFGGGVGTAGFWGLRFSPGTFLAETPTDSWYVRIWAELGLIGIMFHIGILMFIMGRGGCIIWHLKDPLLRQKIMALYSGMAGILIASYGNGVFGQMPTGIIMYVTMVMIFKAPQWDSSYKPNQTEL